MRIPESGQSSDVLSVARIADHSAVLGPGTRTVIWTQGCPLRCRGCIAAETHPFDGGEPVAVSTLAERVLSNDVDGVTFSGGEPFVQARALVRMVDRLRARDPEFSVMSYTGFRLEYLQRRGSQDQLDLLARCDVLVDGPYVARWHASLLWRASTNQRLISLTGKHPLPDAANDRSAGLELELESDGSFALTGVPPRPGFRPAIEQRLDLEVRG